jgi:hypothetical protein
MDNKFKYYANFKLWFSVALLVAVMFLLVLKAFSFNAVVVTWDTPTDTNYIVGYRVYWYDTNSFITNSLDARGKSNNVMTHKMISDIPPDTEIHFFVKSYSLEGVESDQSPIVIWQTMPIILKMEIQESSAFTNWMTITNFQINASVGAGKSNRLFRARLTIVN